MGLKSEKISVDWDQMQTYKNEVIEGNTKGIEFLFKKNKIDWIKGWATIPSVGNVKVNDKTYETKNIIIASGSEPSSLPGLEIDEKIIVSSTGALELKKIPKKMIIIGAGVIGLELGSVYSRLGSDVTVLEYLDNITPGLDSEVQKSFQRILKRQGIKFVMGAAVKSAICKKNKANVLYQKNSDESEHSIEADIVLVATGRKPFTNRLGI